MYYEDFQIGQKWETKERMITEADIVIFSTHTGATNPLFLSDEYARKVGFEGRIAPGLLTASILVGLTYQLNSDPFGEGFIALRKLEMEAKKPVRIGDTIRATVEVVQKEDLGKRGKVLLKIVGKNQKNEEVMELLLDIVVNKKF
ncbi:MAG: MaoC family dehydratase [Sulfolobaceae archaeon]